MATPRWRGDAPIVAQTVTISVTAYDVTTTYKVTMNSKVVSVLGSGGTTTTVATALTAALVASTIPEFLEVTWTSSGAVITGVANGTSILLGKPFVATSSVSGGAGTIGAVTTTVTASGPNDVSLAANWSTGVAPVDGDDVVFDYGNSDVLYNLDNNGVTPATITVLPGFTGKIGLPVSNVDNSSKPYFEYRETYMKYGNSGDAQTVTLTIRGGGGRIKISQGTAQAIWNIDGSGQRIDTGVPAVLLKGTHASNVMNVSKGDVGVAFYGGETATLVTLNVGYQTNVSGDAKVFLGSGVTLTAPAVTVTGGTLELNSAMTGACTLTQYDGAVTYNGTGGLAAGLTVRGGKFIYNTTGTLGGAPVVSGTGEIDFSQNLRAKTVTNPIDMYGPNSKVTDPNKSVATMVVDLDETANSANFNPGKNVRLTRGTPS